MSQPNRKLKLTTAIALVLLITTTFSLLSDVSITQAQFRGEGPAGGVPGPLAAGVVANVTVPTWALLSARPNPAGINQPVLVNLETQPAPGTDRLHQDYIITMTKPDGTK